MRRVQTRRWGRDCPLCCLGQVQDCDGPWPRRQMGRTEGYAGGWPIVCSFQIAAMDLPSVVDMGGLGMQHLPSAAGTPPSPDVRGGSSGGAVPGAPPPGPAGPAAASWRRQDEPPQH